MPTTHSDRSFLKALVFFLLGLVAFWSLVMDRLAGLEPEQQGEVFGRISFTTLLPAIIVGFLSRRAGEYGWLKFGLLYLVVLILLAVLGTIGAASN